MTKSRALTVAVAIAGGGIVGVGEKYGYRTMLAASRLMSQRTVESVLHSRQKAVEARATKDVKRAGARWPVKRLAFVALKEERRFEVWGRTDAGRWRLVRSYPVLAASGISGPKLQEGDRQVPEGIYRLDGLNPNSQFYLSIRVNYPSDEDKSLARRDGRTRLGGDIFIHGSAVSIGCIALGDTAIEEVFVMAALSDRPVPILIAPRDFRQSAPTADDSSVGPPWLKARYDALAKAMTEFKE
jgi:murein L,D-transpeptidase YafK